MKIFGTSIAKGFLFHQLWAVQKRQKKKENKWPHPVNITRVRDAGMLLLFVNRIAQFARKMELK